MRPASFIRRLTSRGGIRSRAAKLFTSTGCHSRLIGWVGHLPERPIHQAAIGALLGLQPLGQLGPELVAHLGRRQCPHPVIGSVNLIGQRAKPLTRRLCGDLLPHVKMRAKVNSLPHVNVRAC
jgi:hypothetical protein